MFRSPQYFEYCKRWIAAKVVRGTEQSAHFKHEVNTIQTKPKMKQKDPSLWNKSKAIHPILPC